MAAILFGVNELDQHETYCCHVISRDKHVWLCVVISEGDL